MVKDDFRRAELLERIKMLLHSLPDETVEALTRQWEQELEEMYNMDTKNLVLCDSISLPDGKVQQFISNSTEK